MFSIVTWSFEKSLLPSEGMFVWSMVNFDFDSDLRDRGEGLDLKDMVDFLEI